MVKKKVDNALKQRKTTMPPLDDLIATEKSGLSI